MMYKFYIAGVLLPIAPQSLSIEVDNKDTEIELANGGVMTVLNSPGLSKYSFTFRAPNKSYPFAMYNKGYIEAPAFLSLLENLKTSQKPFMFKVIRGDKYVEHRDINAFFRIFLLHFHITHNDSASLKFFFHALLKFVYDF